ncbi:hypothetical protein ACFVXQ_21370 [Kitasatospora sp. NPDC058263]
MDRAAAAYEAARADAERHAVAGERATSQAQLAFVRAFTDPARSDDDLDLDLRATTRIAALVRDATTRIAALVRDAGTPGSDFLDRASVLDDAPAFAGAVRTLDQLSRDRDYAYYTDIAHFMPATHSPTPHPHAGSTANRPSATVGARLSPTASAFGAADPRSTYGWNKQAAGLARSLGRCQPPRSGADEQLSRPVERYRGLEVASSLLWENGSPYDAVCDQGKVCWSGPDAMAV